MRSWGGGERIELPAEWDQLLISILAFNFGLSLGVFFFGDLYILYGVYGVIQTILLRTSWVDTQGVPYHAISIRSTPLQAAQSQ